MSSIEHTANELAYTVDISRRRLLYTCTASQYDNGTECLECSSWHALCLTCNITHCLTCSDGFRASATPSPYCFCPAGKIVDAGLCVTCGAGCTNCLTTTSCSACNFNYFLVGQACV